MIGATRQLLFHRVYVSRSKDDATGFKLGKRSHPCTPLLGEHDISQVRKNQKTLQERVTSLSRLIPFKGTYNYLKGNNIKETSRVNPEEICHDTAVITMNNKHTGALMGGFDECLHDWEKPDHVLFFGGEPGTANPLAKLAEKKVGLSLALGIYYGSSYALSYVIPEKAVGFAALVASIKIVEKLGFENPLVSLIELHNLEGVSTDRLKESRYKPVPLVGLDTGAMRERASEIKEKGEYNNVTKNCAWAVLECIRAGLPDNVVKKLPSTGLYVTPTDVENTVHFLVENDYVLLGEMDAEGVAWFDAQDKPS